MPITREELIKAQSSDPTLGSLLNNAVSEGDSVVERTGYYLRNGLLMRKFRDVEAKFDDEIHQVVVPKCFRNKVMSLAHDKIGGHLGVKKTQCRILDCFYWPCITSDVRRFCKSCRACQLAGKPNQPIPPAPLNPIPVIYDPFSKCIIDLVGPLPKTKK